MTIRLREGCAAKIGARGQDAAPTETAAAPASLRNCRRSSETLACFSFFDMATPFCARGFLRPQPFNRRSMSCQSAHRVCGSAFLDNSARVRIDECVHRRTLQDKENSYELRFRRSLLERRCHTVNFENLHALSARDFHRPEAGAFGDRPL